MTADEPAQGQPRPRASTPCSRTASRAYSEHVGANRHARGSNGDTSRWYPDTAGRQHPPTAHAVDLGPGIARQRRPQLTRQGRRTAPSAPPAGRRSPSLACGGRGIAAGAVRLAQPPPRTVALHGVLELAAHGESDARRLGRFPPQHDERRSIDPPASLEERLEFSAGGQPLASGEATRYTVSRLRPFARRRLSTFRPPFVFMRSRKPCVFARRRRFG